MEGGQAMIPKSINYCWFGGGEKSALIKKCIESWKKYNPDYLITEWNESNYDLDKYKFVREAYDAKKWAFVSDVVRLDILLHYGGIYLDTDVELIKPIDGVRPYPAFFAMDKEGINTGIGCGAESGNRIIADLLRVYKDLDYDRTKPLDDFTNTNLNRPVFERYGLVLPVNEITEIQTGVVVYPKEYFDPIDGPTTALLTTEHTIGIHHGTRSWESGANRFKARVRTLIGPKATATIKKILKHS